MMGVNESVDFRHNKEAFRRLFSNGNQGLKDPFLDFAWAANRWSLISSVLQMESAISFRN